MEDKRILMPAADQYADMIRGAWRTFRKNAAEAGFELQEEPDWLFLVGYCAGNHDCLEVIKDQLALIDGGIEIVGCDRS